MGNITAIEAEPEQSDDNKVICPACAHQFRAIPQNVQRLMIDAGFEPPFTSGPIASPALHAAPTDEQAAAALQAYFGPGRYGPIPFESHIEASKAKWRRVAAAVLAAPGKPQGVYAEIQAERARQDEQWGGPSHDDEHSTWDWTRYISHQLSKLVNDDKPRQRLVNIAALAVSAAESMDRKSPGKPQGAQTSGTEGGE